MSKENQIEDDLIKQLTALKYVYRPDIVDRRSLEQNFKSKFETLNRIKLNRIKLTENEFLRLREVIINPDVFAASKLLR
jgi:type I restriction enzyme R subunit